MSITAVEILNLKHMLQEHELNFTYSGYINDSVLTGVGEALKH